MCLLINWKSRALMTNMPPRKSRLPVNTLARWPTQAMEDSAEIRKSKATTNSSSSSRCPHRTTSPRVAPAWITPSSQWPNKRAVCHNFRDNPLLMFTWSKEQALRAWATTLIQLWCLRGTDSSWPKSSNWFWCSNSRRSSSWPSSSSC